MTKDTRTLVEFHIDYRVTMPQCGTKEFSELLDTDMKPCGDGVQTIEE